MANVTPKGNPIHRRRLPKVGSPGPNFRLTRGDLSDISLAGFEGKVEILNLVPTLDTGVGAASARRFEKEAGDLGNVVVLTISRYLSARKRFCTAKNISKVVSLEDREAHAARHELACHHGVLGLLSLPECLDAWGPAPAAPHAPGSLSPSTRESLER